MKKGRAQTPARNSLSATGPTPETSFSSPQSRPSVGELRAALRSLDRFPRERQACATYSRRVVAGCMVNGSSRAKVFCRSTRARGSQCQPTIAAMMHGAPAGRVRGGRTETPAPDRRERAGDCSGRVQGNVSAQSLTTVEGRGAFELLGDRVKRGKDTGPHSRGGKEMYQERKCKGTGQNPRVRSTLMGG